jgi:hypothetical protein
MYSTAETPAGIDHAASVAVNAFDFDFAVEGVKPISL